MSSDQIQTKDMVTRRGPDEPYQDDRGHTGSKGYQEHATSPPPWLQHSHGWRLGPPSLRDGCLDLSPSPPLLLSASPLRVSLCRRRPLAPSVPPVRPPPFGCRPSGGSAGQPHLGYALRQPSADSCVHIMSRRCLTVAAPQDHRPSPSRHEPRCHDPFTALSDKHRCPRGPRST